MFGPFEGIEEPTHGMLLFEDKSTKLISVVHYCPSPFRHEIFALQRNALFLAVSNKLPNFALPFCGILFPKHHTLAK